MGKHVDDAYPTQALPWLTYELDGLEEVTDWHSVVPVLLELLQFLIPSDEIVWNGVDLRTGHAFVVNNPEHKYDPEVTRLLLELDDHPVINAYIHASPPHDASPVRLSDLMDDLAFRRTRTWADLFAPRGVRYQLTAPTAGDLRLHANAWSMNRGDKDFTDADLRLLGSLQPLLVALERAGRWRVDAETCAEKSSLTPRELQVLTLLADGLTATSMAYRLRLSPATVRKHLEHIYDKTGHHDRMMLVQYARRAGLLRPGLSVTRSRAAASPTG